MESPETFTLLPLEMDPQTNEITASQSLADRVRGTHTPNSRDAISIRSTESEWKYHDRIGSNGSDRELDSVVIQALPTDPRREKVFKSMGR